MYFTDFICSQLEVQDKQNLLIFYQSSFLMFYLVCAMLYTDAYIWKIIRVSFNSWGPIDIRKIFGHFLKFWEIFKMRPIILYFLISHCTNYIHAKFHVPRTIF